MCLWSDITPANLPKRESVHPWVFAIYIETPTDRADQQWYTALLFRDKDRTLFGIKEYHRLENSDTLRRLARRIVSDKYLRDSLLSDDLNLPRLWKHH